MKKRALGRNINIFLSQTAAKMAESTNSAVVESISLEKVIEGNLRHIPLELLQRGRYQPRREIAPEAIQELADSIRAQGIIQPIVVRSIEAGRYEIIAGERRWRAAKLAGLTNIPALIKEIPDEAAAAIALIENIQRENLNPIEEAIALQRLLDEFAMTHQEVATAVGKSRTTVTNALRLLSLQPDVKAMLQRGDLEMGHARTLLALMGPLQIEAAKIVADKKLSVRETEKLVQNYQTPHQLLKKSATIFDPNIRHLQQTLSDKLGASISFQHSSKGKGKMIIHYNNLDELDGILQRIK